MENLVKSSKIFVFVFLSFIVSQLSVRRSAAGDLLK